MMAASSSGRNPLRELPPTTADGHLVDDTDWPGPAAPELRRPTRLPPTLRTPVVGHGTTVRGGRTLCEGTAMGSRRSLDKVLDRSLTKRQLVAFQRSVPPASTEHGFVVGISSKWVLFHIVKDGIDLDGYQAVRHRDIARARREARRFSERLLALRNQHPVVPTGIELDRTRDLLRSATKQFRVVAVHPEYDEPEICYVGAAGRYRDATFELREISSEADWLPERFRYTYRSISRIDFDGSYERALLELADAGSGPTPGGTPVGRRPPQNVRRRSVGQASQIAGSAGCCAFAGVPAQFARLLDTY